MKYVMNLIKLKNFISATNSLGRFNLGTRRFNLISNHFIYTVPIITTEWCHYTIKFSNPRGRGLQTKGGNPENGIWALLGVSE